MPITSESRLIAAPVDRVWAAITDLESAGRWNKAWQRVEYLSMQFDGVGATFRAHTEDGLAQDFRISKWAPQEYVEFERLQHEPEEKGNLITVKSQAFHLEHADDDHTKVTLLATAMGHGLRGWLAARFIWPGYQSQGLGAALDALQALFEPPEGKQQEGHAEPD